MLKIKMPTEPGNRAIKDGSLPKLLEATMRKLSPEAAYFYADDGMRTAIMFFDMTDVSQIPVFVEPLFSGVEAKVEFVPVMNADELRKGLGAAMQAM
jgi:hypothetical protein